MAASSSSLEVVTHLSSLLSSQVIISTALPPPTSNPSSSSSSAQITKLPPHVDPSTLLRRHASAESGLTSIILPPTPTSITRILPLLTSTASNTSSNPILIHLPLPSDSDLGALLSLRASGVPILKSTTSKRGCLRDTILLGAKLAKAEGKVVLHVFAWDDDVSSNGNGNGNGNGHVNGDVHEEVTELTDEEVLAAFHSAPVHVQPGHAPSPSLAQLPSSISTSTPTDLTLFSSWETAALSTLRATKRAQKAIVHHGADVKDAEVVLVVYALSEGSLAKLRKYVDAHGKNEKLGLVEVNLIRPLPTQKLLHFLSGGALRKVIVLEQTYRKVAGTRWNPFFLDVLSVVQARADLPDAEGEEKEVPLVVSAVLGDLARVEDLGAELESLSNEVTSSPILGRSPDKEIETAEPKVPAHEGSYTRILEQTFPSRLEIVNSPSLVPALGEIATRPEYAFGKVSALLDKREELVLVVKKLLKEDALERKLHVELGRWLVGNQKDSKRADKTAEEIVSGLESVSAQVDASLVSKALELKDHFRPVSRWIIGSDAWSYDLGSSGIHHAIASGKNVNMLIIDTQPYTSRGAKDAAKRKKDIGLYAMNHGDVYVASVAVYSSYSQVLQALLAADAFDGPSIVLAYLPYGNNEEASAIDVMKETKLAVDNAYWPLYRWDPSQEDVEGGRPFMLDSERIKEALKEFLDRQNHLSQLTAATPSISKELTSSVGLDLQDARKQKAKAAYEKMLNSLDGPPLLVLYASDGGNCEKVAKRLVGRAKTRGLATRMAAMDDFPFSDLKLEKHVVFLTSTAGQGEAPQNGRLTYKSLMQAAEGEWAEVNFTVFAMGDSHYWPRAEDAHYYNKPGKDLDARLEKIGAKRMASLGLGDDQDPDGAQTGYKIWEPLVWKAMGVDSVEILEAEPEPITNENIKIASNYLRGTILEGLADQSTGAIDASDAQLTKFHGTYMQDDRDIRDERKDQGLEPAYSFMIRCRMPGGVCKPEQWLAIDKISDEHGNGTFKLTTRQTFQFHGIIKKHLKPAMQAINRSLLDTIAACGDVNRNVQLSVNPAFSKLHEQVYNFSKAVSEHLLPSTSAYHEIWLDKKLVGGEAVKDFEPLYGPYYLPRKFKIAIAVPPDNSVDVYTNDVGFIAITDEAGELAGFNVTIGGGMGVTHSNKKTYPRLGSLIGFVTPEEGCAVAEKIMLVQRDNGNRADRKNARLKYTVDAMGLENFKAEVEKRMGHKLEEARPFEFTHNIDNFGWVQGHNGKWHFTMFIENGRVEDNDHHQQKTGLKEIAGIHKGDFRLTANQHVILSDVEEADLPEMKRLLAKWKLDKIDFSGLRLSSSACVAFPTCGLAMAESERYLPVLIGKIEGICEEAGLRNDSIVMRMTGCPNGCARPWAAEVAFVGKAPGTYLMMLGGGYYGQRLNKPFRESVTEPEVLEILTPMIKRYALERNDGERFGDWTIRAGYIKPTLSGKQFYEDSVLA